MHVYVFSRHLCTMDVCMCSVSILAQAWRSLALALPPAWRSLALALFLITPFCSPLMVRMLCIPKSIEQQFIKKISQQTIANKRTIADILVPLPTSEPVPTSEPCQQANHCRFLCKSHFAPMVVVQSRPTAWHIGYRSYMQFWEFVLRSALSSLAF